MALTGAYFNGGIKMSHFEQIRPMSKNQDAYYPEDCYPYVEADENGETSLITDSAGNLAVRGSTMTDEGSFRDSFAGTSLSRQLTGTLTFTNGSDEVTGEGTSFLSEDISLFIADFIKLNSDPETKWIEILKIIDDTHIQLAEPYQGTSGSGNSSTSKFITNTASDASISVSNSLCNITSGVTPGSRSYIAKSLDYCPIVFVAHASLSQRILNQIGVIGVLTKPETPEGMPKNSAWFEFGGTDNTKVLCKSTLTSESDSTEVTIPYGYLSSDKLRYRIEVSQEYVQYSIEGVVVATHYNLIPSPYAELNLFCGWINTGLPSSSSTVSVDTIFVNNANILQVQGGFSGLPLKVSSDPTAIKDAQNSKEVQITVTREMRVTDSIRLAGASFWGSTLDTNFWTSSVSNGATNTLNNGEINIASGTTNGALGLLTSTYNARFKTGTQNLFRSSMRLDTGVTGNLRRFGVADSGRNNGFFFEIEGTVFSVGRRKSGTVTRVLNGNFNGNAGSSYNLDTKYHVFEILYGINSAEFYIDSVLVHKMKATTEPLVTTTNMTITFLNNNASAVTSSVSIFALFAVVHGLNGHDTQPVSAVIETNATFTLKIGCGKLKRIVNVDNVGICTVYDNTAGSGTKLLPTLDCARAIGTLDFDVNFNNGLTVVTSGRPKLLVVYE